MIEVLSIVLFLVVVLAVIYKVRGKKSFVISEDGFIPVEMPSSLQPSESKRLYANLRNIERMVRKQCNKTYKKNITKPFKIKKIKMVNGKVSRKNKHISRDRFGKIVLGMQLQKFYLFAKECHNSYREIINDKDFVHEFKDVEDKLSYRLANQWIEDSLGHLKGEEF